MATLTLTPVLEQDDRVLVPVAWPEAETLLVENQVFADNLDEKQQFTLDLATNEIAPAPAQ